MIAALVVACLSLSVGWGRAHLAGRELARQLAARTLSLATVDRDRLAATAERDTAKSEAAETHENLLDAAARLRVFGQLIVGLGGPPQPEAVVVRTPVGRLAVVRCVCPVCIAGPVAATQKTVQGGLLN